MINAATTNKLAPKRCLSITMINLVGLGNSVSFMFMVNFLVVLGHCPTTK